MIIIIRFIKEHLNALWFFGFLIVGMLYFGSKYFATDYFYVHIPLDDKIPFLPIFIIPYIFWYLYVPIPMIYVCFKNKKAFTTQAITMFSGMILCCIGFIIFPTAIDFRPTAEGNGILLFLCRIVYANDNPSANVFPSLHCYEALVVHLTTFVSGPLRKKIPLRIASAITMVLICMSTVFVKQHSFADVISGCALGAAIFVLVLILRGKYYGEDFRKYND